LEIQQMTARSPDARPLVMHVIHHLYVGGLENGLVNLINQMPADKVRHLVVCVEDFSDFRLRIRRDDVEVIALRRSQIGAFAMQRKIFSLCRSLRPAVLHSRNLSGLDALLPAWLAGVPFRLHGEHGFDVDNLDGRNKKHQLLRRLHSPLVHRYITVSRHLRELLVRRMGIAANRITQIYNGVDTDRFKPRTNIDLSRLPQRLRIEGLVLVGTVGRLQPVKDQALLLRAFADALEQKPDLRTHARLAIVGDGPLAAPLQALAQQLGIADLVWFSGAVDDVPAVLGLFDLFVLPSISEGISNTILEAMAMGLPVLATRVGGNIELVEEGRGGQLFASGDQAQLSRLLQQYLGDADMRAAQGVAARARAVQDFSLTAMVAAYQGVYEAGRLNVRDNWGI
jgi:sugar transferase (PEP-CTERM/EpsH1 system associated)